METKWARDEERPNHLHLQWNISAREQTTKSDSEIPWIYGFNSSKLADNILVKKMLNETH